MKSHLVAAVTMAIVTFGSSASAQTTYASGRLEEWLKTRVSYSPCPKDSGVDREEMKAIFEEAVRNGVREIEKINPTLVNDRLYRRWNLKMKVTCTKTGEEAYAEVTTRKWLLIGTTTKVNVGRAFLEEAHSPEFWKMIIFHEYLHAMNFDNVTVKQHNESPFEFLPGKDVTRGEADVVYSCAAAAYSNEGRLYNIRPDVGLQTCKSAYVDASGKVVAPLP